jgi:hypothetical protein
MSRNVRKCSDIFIYIYISLYYYINYYVKNENNAVIISLFEKTLILF